MWTIVTVAMACVLGLVDFQNLLSRQRRFVLEPLDHPSDDFTIVIPLFGHPRYFDERHQLEHVADRILVSIECSSELMRAFADVLEQEGWRVFRTCVASPNPPKLLQAALEAGAVTTTYVMRLDADSAVGFDLRCAIAAAIADGADLCSVKVLARNRHANLCTRLQALEYDMAMLARHYRPWLISGAGVVARTVVLREILRRHSMSPIGEDIEMGRVAFAHKMRIRHLDVVVLTDVPESWRTLFRQRRLWWAGNFRHSVVNFDRNAVQLRSWTLYNVALIWVAVHVHAWRYPLSLLHPSAAKTGLVLLAVVIGAVTTLIANWQVRSPLMAIFPLYAMVQSTLIMSVGAVWYLRLLGRSGVVGRYRFGYRRSGLRLVSIDPGEWTGPGPISFSYQWQVSADGDTWTAIGEDRNLLALPDTVPPGLLYRALIVGANAGGAYTLVSAAVTA